MSDMNCPMFWDAFEKYAQNKETWEKKCGIKVSDVKFRNTKAHFVFMKEFGLEPFVLKKSESAPLRKLQIEKPQLIFEAMKQVKGHLTEKRNISRKQIQGLCNILLGKPRYPQTTTDYVQVRISRGLKDWWKELNAQVSYDAPFQTWLVQLVKTTLEREERINKRLATK